MRRILPPDEQAQAEILKAAVKREREARGFSQKKLAELAGIERSMLAALENAYALPSIRVLLAVAGALGVSVSDLLGDNRSVPLVPNRWLGLEALGMEAEQLRRRGVMVRLQVYPEGTLVLPNDTERLAFARLAWGYANHDVYAPTIVEAFIRAREQIEAQSPPPEPLAEPEKDEGRVYVEAAS